MIATGGGTLIDGELREMMAQHGTLICLQASPADIRARLEESDGRPLAANWERLYQARQTAYAQIPRQILTTGKSPQVIAARLRRFARTPYLSSRLMAAAIPYIFSAAF